MRKERYHERAGRFAITHPFLFCLQGAVIILGWTSFLFRSIVTGALWGLGTLIVGLALWMPPLGPLRRYYENHYFGG